MENAGVVSVRGTPEISCEVSSKKDMRKGCENDSGELEEGHVPGGQDVTSEGKKVSRRRNKKY